MLGASAWLSVALLLGRLTGLLRELQLAALFGVSRTADLAVLLLTLPDLFANLLLAGGVGAALVPRFHQLAQGPAMVLFRQASLAVLLLFGLLGGLLVAWPQAVFYLVAPGIAHPFGAGELVLVVVGLAIPLTAAAGISGAYLNARQAFLAAGSGTLLFNVALIATLALAPGAAQPLLLLAAGILGGAALRYLVQLAALPGALWRQRAQAWLLDAALLRAFVLASAGAVLLLLGPLIVRSLASLTGPGAIASFNFAQKLIELPVTIFISAIGTVALSKLSALHAQGQPGQMRAAALRDCRYALLVALALMVPGVWFSGPAVELIFGRGQMDAAALARIAELAAIGFLGMPMVALSTLASAQLNAAHQLATVLRCTAVALACLPLLVAPGLLLGSERALMLAVVLFQAIAALLLARAAGMAWTGADGLLAPRCLPHFGAVLALALLPVGFDALVRPASPWLQLAAAGAGFGAVMLVPVRRFLRM